MGLLAHAPRQCGGGPRGRRGPRRRASPARWPRASQALLGAVVEVAADAAALLVGRLDHAGAGSGNLGLALAQGDLVAAALDLGGRAGGEDRQRRDLVVAGLDPAQAREDAEVADVRPADPAHRDRRM